MEFSPFITKVLMTILALIIIKITYIVIGNIESKLIKDIRKNRLRYGHIISRKDIAAIKSEVKVKNMFLYKLAFSNSFIMRILPYKYVFDDTSAREQDEYFYWCCKLLVDLGFENIEYYCNSIRGCTDIISTKGGKTFYVHCMLLNQDNEEKPMEEDTWPNLDRPYVQTLVGTMLNDNIFDGIIITTGDFTENAKEYARSLPAPYSLQLIDGCEVTKTVRKLREHII